MKKTLILGLVGLTSVALATDLVLNVKLNGRAVDEGSHKSERIHQFGMLVVQDVEAETNVLSGTLYFLDVAKPEKIKVDGRNRRIRFYDVRDVNVRTVASGERDFGLLVEFEGAQMAGIGRMYRNRHGALSQIVISSGHGAFLYSGYEEELPVSTNGVPLVVEDEGGVLETLEVGKFSVRLNKRLTATAVESNGVWAVEAWLEAKYFVLKESEKNKENKGNKGNPNK